MQTSVPDPSPEPANTQNLTNVQSFPDLLNELPSSITTYSSQQTINTFDVQEISAQPALHHRPGLPECKPAGRRTSNGDARRAGFTPIRRSASTVSDIQRYSLLPFAEMILIFKKIQS